MNRDDQPPMRHSSSRQIGACLMIDFAPIIRAGDHCKARAAVLTVEHVVLDRRPRTRR